MSQSKRPKRSRAKYDPEIRTEVIAAYRDGAKPADLVKQYSQVPSSTVRRWITLENKSQAHQKRSPEPKAAEPRLRDSVADPDPQEEGNVSVEISRKLLAQVNEAWLRYLSTTPIVPFELPTHVLVQVALATFVSQEDPEIPDAAAGEDVADV